jgi:hypothetical protein
MLSLALRSDNLDVEAYCNEQYEFLREARTTTGVTSTLGEVWTNGLCKTMAGHHA